MTKRVMWFALILTALGGAAQAGTSTAYSGMFGVNNGAGYTTPRPQGAVAYSPYSNGAGWNLLRGQLHTHRHSDLPLSSPIWMHPAISESSLAQKYLNMGFDFLALTGHDMVSGESVGWQGWAPHSVELTNATHTLVVGSVTGDLGALAYGDTGNKVSDVVERIRKAHNAYALAFIAHPNSKPYNLSADQVTSICKRVMPEGMGIYSTFTSAEDLWDQVLLRLWPSRVWGYSEDDYHPYQLMDILVGKTWVAVPGNDGEWWGNIKTQLDAGNYYTYWINCNGWSSPPEPPRLRVTVDNGGTYPAITASLTDGSGNPYTADIYFKTAIGFGGGTGSSRTYTCLGSEKYVRVKVVKDLGFGRQLNIASQPILIGAKGQAYRLSSTSRMGIEATTPELTVRYLEEGELPEPPSAGYVGHGFDVSTTDGLVPPGATLQLSFDGEDTSALGGTQYLAIYCYDDPTSAWVKVGGTADPAAATVETPITVLGKYCVSADLPPDTTAPEVFIDNPPSGGVVNMDTTARVTVNDDLGAWRVSFYLNDRLLKEDADSLDFWTADVALADYCEGDWTLKAVAEDLAGNTGTAEIPIHIHSSTPPPTVTLASPGPGATLTGTVTATGTCGDNVGVALVALKVGDTLAGYATIDGASWSCDIDTTYLVDGNRTLQATVEDYPGNSASASVNVAIANGGAASAIGSLKGITDGGSARFSNAIVVAGTNLVGGAFYAEASDRSSGIRVLTDRTISAGDIVSVSGVMTTMGTERAVQAYDVLVASSGNTLPKPIGVAGKLLLAPPPDSIGKIVRCWGSVTSFDPSSPARWFVIDDGSGPLKCTVPLGVAVPTTGFVIVTGVCSVDAATGQAVLLVSGGGDIRTL